MYPQLPYHIIIQGASGHPVRSEGLVWLHMHSGFGGDGSSALDPADVIQDGKEEEILLVETSWVGNRGALGECPNLLEALNSSCLLRNPQAPTPPRPTPEVLPRQPPLSREDACCCVSLPSVELGVKLNFL